MQFLGQKPLGPGGPPPGGGLTGFDSIAFASGLPLETSATTNTLSGTVLGVSAGDLVLGGVGMLGNNSANDSATWTVTLDGIAMTPRSGAGSTSFVMPLTGIFSIVATTSGDLPLSITLGSSARSIHAIASVIKGQSGTPIVTGATGLQHASDVTSHTVPNAQAPSAAGNVIWGLLAVKDGTVSGQSLTGGTLHSTGTGSTGGNASSDHAFASGYLLAPDTSPVTFAWGWTGSNRVSASWVEIAEA